MYMHSMNAYVTNFFFFNLSLWNMYEFMFRCVHFRSIHNYTSGQRQRMKYCTRWQFLEPVFSELFFKRLACARERGRNYAIRRLRFADIIFYYLGKDHAKIFTALSEEAWMPLENWMASDACCRHCPHSSWLSNCYCSTNTKPLKRLFLCDIDSTLEAEPKF